MKNTNTTNNTNTNTSSKQYLAEMRKTIGYPDEMGPEIKEPVAKIIDKQLKQTAAVLYGHEVRDIEVYKAAAWSIYLTACKVSTAYMDAILAADKLATE